MGEKGIHVNIHICTRIYVRAFEGCTNIYIYIYTPAYVWIKKPLRWIRGGGGVGAHIYLYTHLKVYVHRDM